MADAEAEPGNKSGVGTSSEIECSLKDMPPLLPGNLSRTRKEQQCTFCKNHKKNSLKKGHNCLYKNCDCSLCKLQKRAQIMMRHQQKIWRYKKQFLHKMTKDSRFQGNKSQVCDKCRNHNILTLKKNHYCPYEVCGCFYCTLTFKRREMMKYLQRIRRSNLTSDAKETKHLIRAFEMENKCDSKRIIEIMEGRDDGEDIGDSNSDLSTYESILTKYISQEMRPELLGKDDFCDTLERGNPPVNRTASPPPLIPLPQNSTPDSTSQDNQFSCSCN